MAATQNGPELHPTTVELARGANFGTITTMLPSGNLQNHIIWVGTDGERLMVNTEVHRRKFKNIERDPRVTLTIRDEEDPYRYAEARGEVVETVRGQDGPRAHRPALREVQGPALQPGRHKDRAGDALDRPQPSDDHRPRGRRGGPFFLVGSTRRS